MENHGHIDIKKAIVAANDTQKLLRSGITAIRTQIRELKEERSRISNIPVSIDVAKARVREFHESLIGNYSTKLTHADMFIQPPSRYSRPRIAMHLTEVLYTTLASFILEGMEASIDAAYKTIEGINEDDRQAETDVLNRKILDAELSEESLIRAANRSGFKTLRRPDADPLAVMAHDSALP